MIGDIFNTLLKPYNLQTIIYLSGNPKYLVKYFNEKTFVEKLTSENYRTTF